jgi:hypothetical protein
MSRTANAVRYIRTNLDEALIIGALGKMAFSGAGSLGETDQAVLSALRRSTKELHDATPEQVGDYLRGLDVAALPGIVSNTKGILHEMQFVAVENSDGDTVYASVYDATNHPGTDIQFVDTATGETWDAQLKATESAGYANEWIDTHPGGEIFVTDELADRTGLQSSGQSNAELTGNLEQFVDKMVEGDQTIWDHFPVITTLTLANIIWALWQRYQEGVIGWEQFKALAARASGIKVAKIAMLSALLSIPVVGQATGALLIAKFLLGARQAMDRKPPGVTPQKLLRAAPIRRLSSRQS